MWGLHTKLIVSGHYTNGFGTTFLVFFKVEGLYASALPPARVGNKSVDSKLIVN